MSLNDNERPHNLMEALAAVHNSASCNMHEQNSVIATLKGMGQPEVASWLERHQENYADIVAHEFGDWLLAHSHYQRDSLAQEAAAATRLEMPED